MIRSFSEADIARVLTYEELIPAMERALAAFSAGEVIQPVRSVLTVEPGQRYLGVMPAATHEAMGAKLVSFYPKNAGTEVPTHMASIALFESATGRPLAFLDGRLITEMRTAAVSAAVTRHLAPGEAKVLALIGSGVQARAHLEALRHVRRFEEVRVWSPTPAHREQGSERRRLPGDMRVPEGLTALPRHKVCLRVIEAIQGQPSVHDLELSGGQLMDVDAATILRSRVSAPALSSISFRLPHFGL